MILCNKLLVDVFFLVVFYGCYNLCKDGLNSILSFLLLKKKEGYEPDGLQGMLVIQIMW